jgi:Zn-dependent M32 family carboxypeptidase
VSTAKQLTKRKQSNLEAVMSADAPHVDRKWFGDIAQLFSQADSNRDVESRNAIERSREMPSRLKAHVTELRLKANQSWTRAKDADAYIEFSKTESLARYGRARWPF